MTVGADSKLNMPPHVSKPHVDPISAPAPRPIATSQPRTVARPAHTPVDQLSPQRRRALWSQTGQLVTLRAFEWENGESTLDRVPPYNVSRSMLLAFCVAARRETDRSKQTQFWDITGVTGEALARVLQWMKRACLGLTIPSLCLKDLSRFQILRTADAVARLNVDLTTIGLEKELCTYLENLRYDEAMDLWAVAIQERCWNVATAILGLCGDWLHECSLASLVQVWKSSARVPRASRIASKLQPVICDYISEARLEPTDVDLLVRDAPREAFTQRAFRKVALRLWKTHKTDDSRFPGIGRILRSRFREQFKCWRHRYPTSSTIDLAEMDRRRDVWDPEDDR